jgi:uncharacterized protein
MSALERQYADLRLGGTDASVAAICERLGIATVATVNLRDFAAVRPRHIPAFVTVPTNFQDCQRRRIRAASSLCR